MDTMLRLVIGGDSKGAQKALSDLEGAAKKAGGSLDAPSQKLGALGDKMTGAGTSMSMGITLPLLALGAGAATVAAKFETSMNMVQQASGATASEMKDLEQYAKDMGAATVFSAGEAADAMLELSKSGLTSAQIKGGALKATMDLAAAGNLALADAATITSNAMNTFGLAASDAGSAAAALAGGANASSADVSDLALALSQVGPGAKTAGLSLQETVAVLAEFADKGIRGSDAGTSLKTMLTRLIPSTDKAAGMMEKLGISFVNSDGSMKSISEVAEILQQKMGGLSQEQQTLAMNTMFGSDATRAATILMQGGAEGLVKYTKATNDQSAASDMAAARMKGLGGALDNMKGSLESAGISIGQVLAPAIEDVAGGIKWLADLFAGMPGWAQKVAVGAGLIVAALGPILVITGKILGGLQSIRNFSFKRQIAVGGGGSAAPTGPAAAGGGSQSAASGSVTQLGRASAVSAGEVATLGRAAAGASGSASKAGTQVSTLGKNASTTGTQVGGLGKKAQTTVQPLTNLGGGAKTAAPAVRGLGGIASKAGGRFERINTAMSGTAGSIALTMALSAALAYTIPKVLQAGDAFLQWMGSLGQAAEAKQGRQATQKTYKQKLIDEYGSVANYAAYLRERYANDPETLAFRLRALDAALKNDKGPGNTGNAIRGGIRPQALGGDYWVTRPTLFLAGEAGPERATFTPQGSSAPGGKVVQLHVHVHAEGANFIGTDRRAARQLADMVGPDVRAQILAATGTGF